MVNLADDLRLTVRRLKCSPGFLLTAIVTLALAIAANVVVAGVANGLLFHHLPVPAAGQLVQVQNPSGGLAFSYPNYRDLRDRSAETFSTVALARLTRSAVTIQGATQPIWVFAVSGNYFSMLGLNPEIGRLFAPADDTSVNASRTIILSDGFWRSRFNADPKDYRQPGSGQGNAVRHHRSNATWVPRNRAIHSARGLVHLSRQYVD